MVALARTEGAVWEVDGGSERPPRLHEELRSEPELRGPKGGLTVGRRSSRGELSAQVFMQISKRPTKAETEGAL
eukprot:13914153-Alexandrium_andersonii.AAC.1